jgi:hypothetical protein
LIDIFCRICFSLSVREFRHTQGRVLLAYLEWWLNGVETQTALARYERVGRGRKVALTHGLNQQIAAMERELIEKKRRYAEAAMLVFAGKTG